MGERKGIWYVKKSCLSIPKDSPVEDLDVA